MRKAILALVLLVVVICGIAASSLRSRVAASAPAIGRELAERIGSKVEIGDVSVSLLPLSAKIRDVRVTRRDVPREPFLVFDAVRVEAALPSLLAGELRVRDVVLEKPRLEVTRDETGAQLSRAPDDLLEALAKLSFSARVVDGEVRYEDRTATPPRRFVADAIDGTLSGGADGSLTSTRPCVAWD